MEQALTVDEAAKACQVPVATMAQWRRKNIGPPWYKSGKYVRYRPTAIEKWMKEQEDEQTQRRKSA